MTNSATQLDGLRNRSWWIGALLWVLAACPLLAADRIGAGLNLPEDPLFDGYQLTNILGDLRFEGPVAVVSPPQETHRLFVVEKAGRIQVIPDLTQPSSRVFLDLTASTDTSNLETGLLGLAFHPGFATNRTFFVYRTLVTSTSGRPNALHCQLSRFRVDESDPNRADPASEVVLFAQYDSAADHNSGDLHFGPDGYLYVSVGEDYELWFGDPQRRQAIDRHLQGGILRLDVDLREGSLEPNSHPGVMGHYRIPPDNPFVGITSFNGREVDPARVRTEFWAVGFRNPWRFSFDPETGDLYCGDVGAFTFEEINRVERGGNYGWPFMDGPDRYPLFKDFDLPSGFEPKASWLHYRRGASDSQGNCVIGGLVYRGRAMPELVGSYLYGDFTRGHIWAAREEGGEVVARRLTGNTSVSAFGIDPRDGEVLVVNYRSGRIRKLVHVDPEVAVTRFPQRLSEVGAFASLQSLEPAAGVTPYSINVPFWSDHAIKRRWYSLPSGASFEFQRNEAWGIPNGAVWVKHFEMEMVEGDPLSRRRLETRFLVQTQDDFYGVTYRWNEAQTDAELVSAAGLDEALTIRDADGAVVRQQTWRYPSHNECRTCHNRPAGLALGFTTAQLNRDVTVPGGATNQLQWMAARGVLSGLTGSEGRWPALVRADDETQPLLDRVRSYLAANCASCHQPGTGLVNGASWDARPHVSLAASGITNMGYITPGSLGASTIFQRVQMRGEYQMPPIATQQLDGRSVDLLRRWILSRPPAPWTAQDVGQPGRDGSSSYEAELFVVAGSGALDGTSDHFHFLRQTLEGDRELLVRVIDAGANGVDGRAGLMVRRSIDPRAPFVFLGVDRGGQLSLMARRSEGEASTMLATAPVTAPLSLRLAREGTNVVAWFASDGSAWQRLDSVAIELDARAEVGVAVTSSDPGDVFVARMEGLAIPSAMVSAQVLTEDGAAPASIELSTSVSGISAPAVVERAEFFVQGVLIGQTTEAPFRWTWHNVPAGEHQVTVRMTDNWGRTWMSPPVSVPVQRPVARAEFRGADTEGGGQWKGRYGSLGHRLAADGWEVTAPSRIEFTRGFEFVWDEAPDSSRALQRSVGDGRLAACWVAGDQPELEVFLDSGRSALLTAYVLDWDTVNERAQRMELWDADRNVLLDSREVREFSNGVYLTWLVRGRVRVVAVPLGEAKSVISGLFLDPSGTVPPTVRLVTTPEPPGAVLPRDVTLRVESPVGGPAVERVEYFANGRRLGVTTQTPFDLRWFAPTAGVYSLAARAFTGAGDTTVSDPVTLELVLPAARATFMGSDSTVAGQWRGVVGTEGWWLPELDREWPTVVPTEIGATSFQWPDLDPGAPALERPDGSGRIASAFYDFGEVALSLTSSDGHTREVGLYLLDWDRIGRRTRIEVLDRHNGGILDEREVSGFEEGQLLRWQITGSVLFRIMALTGNAVLNGVFLDPAVPPWEQWRHQYFTEAELLDPAISGDSADRDLDGVPNLAEFALGLDPAVADAGRGLRLGRDTSGWWLTYPRRQDDPSLVYDVQVSEDLVSWEPAGAFFGPESSTGAAGSVWRTVLLRERTGAVDAAGRYVRLRIGRTAP